MENWPLHHVLMYLDKNISERRKYIETFCKETELLFKPWKKKEIKEDDKELKTVNTKIETDYTPEEKDGLDMINNILKKAQKTIAVQKKKKEICQKDESNNNTQAINGCKETVSTVSEKFEALEIESSVTKETTDPNKVKNKQTDVIPETKNTIQAKKISPNVVEKTVQCKERKNQQSGNMKSRPLVPVSVISNTNDRRSNSRDFQRKSHQVGGSTSSISKKQKIAAHMSAPFKTDPNIKVPKRPPSALSLVKPQKPAKSRYMTSNRTSSANSIAKSVNTNQSSQIKTKSKSLTTYKPHETEKKSVSECLPELLPEVVDKGNQNCTSSSVSETKQTKQTVIDESDKDLSNNSNQRNYVCESEASIKGANCNENVSDESKMFHLLTDGSSLKVPGKLRKLVSENKKLLQRVHESLVTKK